MLPSARFSEICFRTDGAVSSFLNAKGSFTRKCKARISTLPREKAIPGKWTRMGKKRVRNGVYFITIDLGAGWDTVQGQVVAAT
jgi:hypothetical protein